MSRLRVEIRDGVGVVGRLEGDPVGVWLWRDGRRLDGWNADVRCVPLLNGVAVFSDCMVA
jgi:hypothetical protein